jgi:hypothetical protein
MEVIPNFIKSTFNLIMGHVMKRIQIIIFLFLVDLLAIIGIDIFIQILLII